MIDMLSQPEVLLALSSGPSLLVGLAYLRARAGAAHSPDGDSEHQLPILASLPGSYEAHEIPTRKELSLVVGSSSFKQKGGRPDHKHIHTTNGRTPHKQKITWGKVPLSDIQ